MSRTVSRTALTDEVASFQAEISRLAFAAAAEIVRAELARRRAAATSAQLELLTPAQLDGPAASAPGAESPSTASASKRTPWTRETIVERLAASMLSGAPVDAAFMTRHGPRGMVAAIRRIFGRFDAALNVAALHLSKLYPEGIPDKRSAAAAARRAS